MVLINLELRNFKGIRDFTFNPNGKSVSVFGDNRIGKTTLQDAYWWLLFDKDSKGRSTGYFSLKTKENGEVIHSIEHEVEGTFSGKEIAGGQVKFRKVYREKWVRKRGNAHEEFDGHTTDYFVDDIEVKMSEYQDKVSEIIGEDLFKILTDPIYFAETLDKDERRSIIKQLCDEVDTEDVVAGDDLLEEYPLILDGMAADKKEKQLKDRRRKLDKRLGNIPDRIDQEHKGLYHEVGDTEEARSEIEELKEKKDTIEAKRSKVKSGGTIAELKVQQQELEAEKQKAKTEHQKQVNDSLAAQREKVSDLQDKVDEAESDWRVAKREYETLEDRLNNKQNDIDSLKGDLEKLRKKQPEPANAFEPEECPVCERASGGHYIKEVLNDFYNFVMDEGTGTIREDDINSFLDIQDFDDVEEHDYEAYLEEFNERKAEAIRRDKEDIADAKEDYEAIEGQLEVAGEKASKAKGLLNQRKQALEKAEAELKDKKQNQPAFTDTDAFNDIQEQINEIGQKIENHQQEKKAQLDKLDDLIEDIEDQIEAAQETIHQAKENKRTHERIAELKDEQKEVSKKLEEVEHQLHVMEQYTQAESEYINRMVSDKFEIVDWKLFDQQINGGIKPDCTALVNGIPFDAGLNDGHRIIAGLDIINTLSNHFDTTAPIWIDGAESVTRLPDIPNQVIALVVSEPDKELRVEEGLPSHKQELAIAN